MTSKLELTVENHLERDSRLNNQTIYGIGPMSHKTDDWVRMILEVQLDASLPMNCKKFTLALKPAWFVVVIIILCSQWGAKNYFGLEKVRQSSLRVNVPRSKSLKSSHSTSSLNYFMNTN